MEFAEWVVDGLDRYRTGQLPNGQAFYTVVWNRLGTDARVTAFMNGGDPLARQALLELVAQTLEADPEFGPALQAAAPDEVAAAKRPFYKAPAGIAAIAVVVLALAGGGVALALSGGSGGLLTQLKGTWHCKPANSAGALATDLTVGDGTWKAGQQSGTWKQDGGTLSLSAPGNPKALKVTGVPGGFGALHATVQGPTAADGNMDVSGTTAKNKLDVTLKIVGAANPADDISIGELICTRG